MLHQNAQRPVRLIGHMATIHEALNGLRDKQPPIEAMSACSLWCTPLSSGISPRTQLGKILCPALIIVWAISGGARVTPEVPSFH